MKKIELNRLSKEELIEEHQKVLVEHDALIESFRAILVNEDFKTAAKEIFNYCKKVTGATSGYRFYRQKTRWACPLDECRYFCAIKYWLGCQK